MRSVCSIGRLFSHREDRVIPGDSEETTGETSRRVTPRAGNNGDEAHREFVAQLYCQPLTVDFVEHSSLLSNTNVILIGGGKLQSKRNQLGLSLGKLGVRSKPQVFDPFEDFKGLS